MRALLILAVLTGSSITSVYAQQATTVNGVPTQTVTTTTQSAGDSSTALANTQFVSTAIANAIAGVNPAVAVLAASTANQTGTYSNGVAGVGATFTITATGVYTLDGITINAIGQRVLFKNQSSGFQNGIYFATVVGAVAISPVFTRALDYDAPSDINSTGAIPVQSGTANALTSWLLTSTVNTVGTGALTYAQFSYNPSTLFPTSANGLATNGANQPIAQTSANVAAMFSGTCPAGATSVLGTNGVNQCITTFPNSNLRGTFLGVGMNNSATGGLVIAPFTDIFAQLQSCSGTNSQFFLAPASGFVRNVTGNLSGTSASGPISLAVSPNCFTTSVGGLPNSLMIPPTSAAGGYVNSWATNPSNFIHINQYESTGMVIAANVGTPASVLSSIGAEFISDDGTADSILGVAQSVALTASSTQFYGFDAFLGSTENQLEIPIPIAGTLKNLMVSVGGSSPTNNVVFTVNKNTTNTALTVTATGGDTANAKYVDVTHTASVVAGDYIDVQSVSGASTQTTFKAISLLFVPGDSTSAILHGSFNNGTVTTTAKYAQAFSALTSTTEANTEYTFPMACSVSHLYVYQIAANAGGVITTFTIYKNNASTAVTGTITNGSGSGSIAVDTTHSVSFAQGDRFSLQYVTGSGTSGAMSGWAAQCN